MRFTFNTGVVQVRNRYCWTVAVFSLIGCLYFIHLHREPINFPKIYVITPTHQRLTQKANLVHIMTVLRSVDNVLWIIAEDSPEKSNWLKFFLDGSKVRYVHLNAETPPSLKAKQDEPVWKFPRGVDQRNAGLKWLRQNRLPGPGVLYFMDDDNTYHPQIFEEIRSTKRVSIWPVAFVGEALVESPVVENGKVVDFIGGFGRYRKFPVDMAGFAINMDYISKNPDVIFSYEHGVGMQETKFLEQLGMSLDDLEPLAHECTEVLVWHTQTRTPIVNYPVPWVGGHV